MTVSAERYTSGVVLLCVAHSDGSTSIMNATTVVDVAAAAVVVTISSSIHSTLVKSGPRTRSSPRWFRCHGRGLVVE